MTFGDLFAGIGGMSLGLERAGMECRFQVEIDPFCQKVLAKHWPHVRIYGDIRTVSELEPVDLIAGGFPCQDISYAGKGAGIDGERSGLWSEMLRIVRLVRPRFVFVENVPALLTRGLERVLGQLAESGYDAEWSCLSASMRGAEHERERVFIVAYPMQPGLSVRSKAKPHGEDARVFGKRFGSSVLSTVQRVECGGEAIWRGTVHGIPRRVDRIRSLGNAVYPACAEWIGHRIMEAAA